MSQDVITVGLTMRISLLYWGEYSQWSERFMNYLEEQTDGEAMINYIKNGELPLPVVAQVSLAENAPNAPPTLKDPKFWTAGEKKTQTINHALERQMRGSEYGEQDWKAAILYEYETFKATEGEQLLDTYLRYLQKQYDTLMRQTKNLMDINIDALYNILKQNQSDVNDAIGYKKKAVVVSSDPLVLVAEKIKVSKLKEKVVVQSESEGSDDEDINDLKKITVLLAKAFNRKKYYAKPTNNNLQEGRTFCQRLQESKAWMESSSDLDQEISTNMIFMAKMEKVLSDLEESSSSAKETIAEVSYYSSNSKSEYEYETPEYYDNSTNYGLFVDNDDDQEIFHDAIESASENFNKNHIVAQKDHDESEVDHNDFKEKGY
ncbi:hypothetical protein Tco_1006344 [Tanacetum coccineum]|uniref:DUF4219 domain-containing protein n=1 Tax=Tanacetum coccineum TaxID=301880 RepID=A0ABQ5FHC1_9ASTR